MKNRFKTRKPCDTNGKMPSPPPFAHGEDLRNGMWPRSLLLWCTVFYMALYIIRPWEVLFPWLAPFRLERLVAIVLIFQVFLDKRGKFRLDMNGISIITLILLVGLTVVSSDNVPLCAEAYWSFVAIIIFSMILKQAVQSLYQVVYIIGMHVFIMTLYLSKSLWEFFIHGRHRSVMGVTRLTGIESTFSGPNSLSMTIVVSLPFLYLLWVRRKYISQQWPKKWRTRFNKCLIYYTIIAVLSIFMTNSRSGVVGLVAFIALLWIRQSGFASKIKVFFLCVLVLAGLWISLPQENKDRLTTIWNPESGPKNAQLAANGRIEGFLAGIQMFNDSPITGVGYGNFVAYRVKNIDGVPQEAHNLVGQALGETGTLGTVGFLFFLAVAFRGFSQLKKTAKRISLFDKGKGLLIKGLAQSYADIFILLLVLGLFGHNFSRYNWYWTAVLAAETLYLARAVIKKQELSGKSIKRTRKF